MTPAEQWRPIPGQPGYEVSSLGRVRSWRAARGNDPRLSESHELHSCSCRRGYRSVSLRRGRGGGWTSVHIHRLVMEAFVGPCPEGLQVRHLNGNPADNRLANLRYGTAKENYADAVRHGTSARGERNGNALLTCHQVDAVRFAVSLGRFSMREIARRLGVPHHAAAACAIPGGTWSWRKNPWATAESPRRYRPSKLRASDVVEIRARAADGESQARIAEAFGIAQSSVSKIVSGRRWEHIPMPKASSVASLGR